MGCNLQHLYVHPLTRSKVGLKMVRILLNHPDQEKFMAKANIDSGICGFITNVKTTAGEDHQILIKIESECPDIQKLAENISEVNPWEEISYRKGVPSIISKGQEYCAHPGCPVPAGIIKAVEVEAGLALPKDASIQIEK